MDEHPPDTTTTDPCVRVLVPAQAGALLDGLLGTPRAVRSTTSLAAALLVPAGERDRLVLAVDVDGVPHGLAAFRRLYGPAASMAFVLGGRDPGAAGGALLGRLADAARAARIRRLLTELERGDEVGLELVRRMGPGHEDWRAETVELEVLLDRAPAAA